MIYGPLTFYDDELFISGLARMAKRLGITSKYQFMNYVFNLKPQNPSFLFSTNIKHLKTNLYNGDQINFVDIVKSHTLFPLFSKFTSEHFRRSAYLNLFNNHCSGITASKLGTHNSIQRNQKYYRYCPICLVSMFAKHKEYYWKRSHQVTGVEICTKHMCKLVNSKSLILRNFIANLIAASDQNCPHVPPEMMINGELITKTSFAYKVAKLIDGLLDFDEIKPPTYTQWTHFYRDLAYENGFISNRHLQLNTKKIKAKLDDFFINHWLAEKSFNQNMYIYNQIIRIFFKHIVPLNYLIHVFLWAGFIDSPNAREIIKKVKQYPVDEIASNDFKNISNPSVRTRKSLRRKWVRLVKKYHTTNQIFKNCQDAKELYLWLLMHDFNWMKKF